jgi:hypothetical protein
MGALLLPVTQLAYKGPVHSVQFIGVLVAAPENDVFRKNLGLRTSVMWQRPVNSKGSSFKSCGEWQIDTLFIELYHIWSSINIDLN